MAPRLAFKRHILRKSPLVTPSPRVRPGEPGQMIAPRDEIFTVLGEQVGENGEIVPIGFDIASNFYFWFYRNANRPDLAGAKMDCQTPYGTKCALEATGI